MLDDKYRIERLLATGGMGAVYLGTHINLRKRVAIKILNPQLSSAQMVKRFHREAITASQIGHEGIAQVTDIGTSREGEPFLVMEYLDGESLAARLRASGPLSVGAACELACAILSPLAAAHRAGIVHRDLKPDNVFLVRQSYGEMVKLLDFGISRATGLESEFRLTTTGLVLGTPYYMSPEQARGNNEISPAADLYAIGVILYEMLIGNVPIQAENYNQLMYRVMTSDFARPRQRRPELPEELERIILSAMAQEPEDRPGSAVELEQSLLAFCRPVFRDRASGSMSAPGLPLPTPPPPDAYRTGNGIGRTGGPGDYTVAAGSHVAAAAPRELTNGGQVAVTSRERPSVIASRRRSRAPWIVGAVILIAGVAGAAVVVGRGDPPVVPPQPPPTQQPPTLPVAAATVDAASVAPSESPAVPDASEPASPSVAPPPVAPAATTITLRFAIEPAGAVILLDGAQIKAAELVVAKDDASHTLRITAPGYVGHDETVRFDESQRLAFQLKRAPKTGRGNDHKRDPGDRTDRPDRPDRNDRTDRIDSESPYK
jgi:eukaryotic-like serine/threonine-protein kinase